MKTRMRPLALVGIVSALGAGSALAQSNASAQPQVTQAITVVAQREPVITVLAPREKSSGPAEPRRQAPPAIGRAVDADGDGIADAPEGTARESTSGRPSGKHGGPTTAAKTQDCGDKTASTTQKSACANSNPKYADKGTQGQNPPHEP
jgi:hypothetical protein